MQRNSIDQLIRNLLGSISDVEAVIADLRTAKDEDGDLSEVNHAYGMDAVSRIHSVMDAIKADSIDADEANADS